MFLQNHSSGSCQQEIYNDNECDIDMSLCDYYDSQNDQISPNEPHDNGLDVHTDVHASSSKQRPGSFPIDLIDVDIDEIAEGPVPSQDNSCIGGIVTEPTRLSTSQENSHEHPTAKRATIPPALNGKRKLNKTKRINYNFNLNRFRSSSVRRETFGTGWTQRNLSVSS